jgi:cystathionine gamma-synthase
VGLVALAGGAVAAGFASGQAAAAAVLQSLRPGDHVIAPAEAYYGIGALLKSLFAAWRLESTFADMTDLETVRRAFRPNTRLVWVETPSNPMLRITDVESVAVLAHERGARLACDNTWATPILSRPLELGADLVIHATTKYLGGHSDVLGGVVVTRAADEQFAKIREIQQVGGGVAAPFDCWLVLRGIRTLPYRIRAHSLGAMAVARFLDRIVFCLFAEDVGLLPSRVFTRVVENTQGKPERFRGLATDLFARRWLQLMTKPDHQLIDLLQRCGSQAAQIITKTMPQIGGRLS